MNKKQYIWYHIKRIMFGNSIYIRLIHIHDFEKNVKWLLSSWKSLLMHTTLTCPQYLEYNSNLSEQFKLHLNTREGGDI